MMPTSRQARWSLLAPLRVSILLLAGCPQAFVIEDPDGVTTDARSAGDGGVEDVSDSASPEDAPRIDTFIGFDGGPPPPPTCEGLIEASPVLEVSCRDPAQLETVERTDRFGEALALGEGELFVAAPGYQQGLATGAVAVYGETEDGYRQTQWLLRRGIGSSLAVRGARLLVGADSESIDRGTEDHGYVVEYERRDCGWVRLGFIDSPAVGEARQGDRFGASIALHDDFAIIGSGRVEGESATYYSMRHGADGWRLTDTLSCGQATQQHKLHATISSDGETVLVRNDEDAMLCLFHRADAGDLLWNPIGTTTLDNAVNFQGANVSISEDLVFVGSSSLRFEGGGIRTQAGAVRVYTLGPDGLVELPDLIIREPVPTTRHEFGVAVHAECDGISRECMLWVASAAGSEDADEAGVLWRVVWHRIEGVRSIEPLATCPVGSQGEIGRRAVFRGDEAFVSSPYYGQAWRVGEP